MSSKFIRLAPVLIVKTPNNPFDINHITRGYNVAALSIFIHSTGKPCAANQISFASNVSHSLLFFSSIAGDGETLILTNADNSGLVGNVYVAHAGGIVADCQWWGIFRSGRAMDSGWHILGQMESISFKIA